MAVREKTLTRSVPPVKHLPTGSTLLGQRHKKFRSAAVLPPLLSSLPRHRIQQPRTVASPATGHESRVTGHVTSSNTCHTTPKSYSTDPPNASPHAAHAAPADKSQTPPPPRTASARDTAPGSAPADQSCPHRLAAPASASSHSSNTRMASYSRTPPASPTARRRTIHPPPDGPPCQI